MNCLSFSFFSISYNYLLIAIEDLDLMSGNLSLVTRVVDHWNVLSQCSINCNSINTFKKYIAHDLELGTVKI